MIINVIIIFLVINIYITHTLSKTSTSIEALFNICPDLGKKCDAGQSPLCCNNRAVCRSIKGQTSSESTFICSIPAQLGEFCLYDVECLRLDNAFCYTELHQCRCLTGFGDLNKNGRCVPLIGGVCRVDAECKVPYAICVESKCQCQEKFIKISQTQCVHTSIGRTCKKDLDCNDILHVGCSVGRKCACKDNHILLNNSTCVPLLDEFCWSNERCAVDNSVCFQNTCQCKPGYTFQNNTYCSKLKLFVPCRKDEECSDVPHAVCSYYGRCVCEDKYVAVGTEECRSSPNVEEMY